MQLDDIFEFYTEMIASAPVVTDLETQTTANVVQDGQNDTMAEYFLDVRPHIVTWQLILGYMQQASNGNHLRPKGLRDIGAQCLS